MSHIDATYKLLKLGYSVIIFGCIDSKQSFHVIAFAIMQNEIVSDCVWIFDQIKDICNDLGNTLAQRIL
jgi:MULE transposase domain